MRVNGIEQVLEQMRGISIQATGNREGRVEWRRSIAGLWATSPTYVLLMAEVFH